MKKIKVFLNDFHYATFILVVLTHVLIVTLSILFFKSNQTFQNKAGSPFFAAINIHQRTSRISNEVNEHSEPNEPNKSNEKIEKKNIPNRQPLTTPFTTIKLNNIVKPVQQNNLINATPISGDDEKNDFDSLIRKNSQTDFTSNQRYQLTLPKQEPEQEKLITPAQQAAQDVRSNSPKLTKSEKFAIAAGTFDCIFQKRLADGSVIRIPGIWEVVPARTVDGRKILATARFCIQLNKKDESGNSDMQSINEGLRGKF